MDDGGVSVRTRSPPGRPGHNSAGPPAAVLPATLAPASRSVRRTLATVAVSAGLTLGCRTPAATSAAPPVGASAPGPPSWRALDVAARADPRLAGVWEAQGFGHLVAVAADSVRVFHHAAGRCVADPGLVPGFALYALAGDGARLSLLHQDYGPASEALQTRVDLHRLPALAAACSPGGALAAGEEQPTPAAVFDALDALMDEHYAFFAERGVDLPALRARYRPLAARAPGADSLFAVLCAMLVHLNDGHVTLARPSGPSCNAGRPALRARLVAAWRREGARGASGDYVGAWHRGVVESVPPLLDVGSRREGAAGALEWGGSATRWPTCGSTGSAGSRGRRRRGRCSSTRCGPRSTACPPTSAGPRPRSSTSR